MKTSKLASIILALFLQCAPFLTRTVQALPGLANSPAAIVLKWVIGALAVAGTYHTVSAASATLVSASTIRGTVGTRLSYQIKISDGQTRFPESWVINGQAFNASGSTTAAFPPGLTMSLSTGIISGVPSAGGTTSVNITAYEFRNLQGHSTSFTLTFIIAGGTTPPSITTAPQNVALHAGETLSLNVVASGTGPLSYKWQHQGTDVPGQTGSTLTIAAVGTQDAGTYVAVVTGPGGSTTSAPATVQVIPLSLDVSITSQHQAAVVLQTISGRQYTIEAANLLDPTAWQVVAQPVATGSTLSYTDPGATNTIRFWRYHPGK